MLQEDENKSNKNEQSTTLLNQENNKNDAPKFALWKRGVLFGIGIIGIELFVYVVALMVIGVPKSDRMAALNLITYAFMFAAMMAVVFLDIPKFLKIFKGWKPYVFGLAFAIGIMFFDIFYTNIINLFRDINTSSNEESVRGVIDIYPVASIFILGIIGPLCEELAYRVGLFGLLRKVNRVLAYIVTGLVFGLLHFHFESGDLINELIFLPTYIVPGVLFSLAYDLFGLACSWTAHTINNVWAILMHILLQQLG